MVKISQKNGPKMLKKIGQSHFFYTIRSRAAKSSYFTGQIIVRSNFFYDTF